MIESVSKVLMLLIASLACVGISGCGGSSEPTVITPTEVFQEDPAVAAIKAEEVERTKNDPL